MVVSNSITLEVSYIRQNNLDCANVQRLSLCLYFNLDGVEFAGFS